MELNADHFELAARSEHPHRKAGFGPIVGCLVNPNRGRVVVWLRSSKFVSETILHKRNELKNIMLHLCWLHVFLHVACMMVEQLSMAPGEDSGDKIKLKGEVPVTSLVREIYAEVCVWTYISQSI